MLIFILAVGSRRRNGPKVPTFIDFFSLLLIYEINSFEIGEQSWRVGAATNNTQSQSALSFAARMTHNCIVCWWFQVRWCGRLTSWLACIVRHCETRRIKPHSSPTTQRLSHYYRERTREASLWCKMSFFLFICCNNDVKEQKVASVLGVLVHVAAFVTSEISLQFMWRQRSQCYLYFCVLKQI